MQPKGIIWAGLSVQDLAGEIAFYRDVLGLTLRRSGADWAHFEAGGGALFELFSGGQAREEAKSPAEQALVIGFEVADLAAEVALLESRGVQFTGEIESYRQQSWATFVDPEGNRLELKEIRN